MAAEDLFASVLPDTLLAHTATPVSYPEVQSSPAQWIEGEPGPTGVEPVQGIPFPCVLFLPSPGGSADTEYRPRVVRRPTLLYNPTRDDGTPIVIRSEDELLIAAPELAAWTGGDVVRWQAQGSAQPFGPPGSVYGLMATLRQILD